jgi:PAS domain S-box-containing protein
MKAFVTNKKYAYFLTGVLVFLGIYLTSHYNYLLFHSLAEVFSIVIACGIFMIAWNSRRFLESNYLLFIGIAYLFVGGLDLIHTLAYKGMGVFHGYETNLPTQLWIAARYMESLSLFLAPLFFGRKLKANLIFLGYTLVTSILLLFIFYWNIFPVCFVEGVGLTPFKKISEYIISLILLGSIVLLLKNRKEFERNVLQWVVWSIIVTIVSELAFTFYIDAYGFSNLIGHFFKILSFYFIYKAIIETGLTHPYNLLFRNLKKSEETLRDALKESQQRQREISTLLEGAQTVLEYHEFKEAAQSLFNFCKDLVGATAGYVSLLNKDGTQNEALFVDSGGFPCTIDPSLPMPIRGLRELAVRTGKTVFHNDFPKSEYIQFVPEGHSSLSNVLFAPLAIKGKVVGLLGLSNKSGGFTENDARMASAFSELAAIALVNIRSEEELQKAYNELEQRVEERTSELIKTNQELQKEIIERKKAEKNLSDQSRILEAFFTSTITPLIFLDRDFNFIRVNEAYAKACQRDISEFPGHNHFEFYPSDAKAIFEQVVETKMPYHAIAQAFTFPDHPEWGTTYWDWTLTPLLDNSGEVEHLVFSLNDATKRKRAENAVKAERQRFNDLLEILPAYLVLLTPDYHVPFANRFFRERFGESHGRPCFEYLFGRSEPCEICETYTVLKTTAPHEWEWTGPDARNYHVYDFPFTDTDGSTLILEMGLDITERKRAEEALRAAHQYNRSLIEASLDPLVTISADGKVMDVNRATELVTGVPREQLIGSDFWDYFTEPEKAKEGYKKVFSEGSVRDYPLAIRHSSSHITEVLYNATVYRNEAGEVQGVFAAARDITDRKMAEKALQESESRLRHLSSQLLTVQENERKRISREIHDSIGQTLAAIKFGLENKLNQIGKGPAPPGVSLESIISLAQNGIEESRRIQMDLRPSILDDLGILATIGWFTREFQKVYSQISVEKETNIEEKDVPNPLKIVIFRIIQEAMNNISKHSRATLIQLSLGKRGDKIELMIEDNGMGFDLETSKRGLGLTSMRERTELSGGAFVIESTPGKGTIIHASWPL